MANHLGEANRGLEAHQSGQKVTTYDALWLLPTALGAQRVGDGIPEHKSILSRSTKVESRLEGVAFVSELDWLHFICPPHDGPSTWDQ